MIAQHKSGNGKWPPANCAQRNQSDLAVNGYRVRGIEGVATKSGALFGYRHQISRNAGVVHRGAEAGPAEHVGDRDIDGNAGRRDHLLRAGLSAAGPFHTRFRF